MESIRLLVDAMPESVRVAAAIIDGRRPLHCAVAREHPRSDVTRFLVEREPESLLCADARGHLPLHLVLLNEKVGDDDDDHERIIRLLVEAGPGSVRHRDRQGRLPLHLALARRHPTLGTEQQLVETWPESIQQPDPTTGLFPVHIAAAIGAPLDVVYFLSSKRPEALKSDSRTLGKRGKADAPSSSSPRPEKVPRIS